MNPFSGNLEETVGSIGESKLIMLIQEWLGPCSPTSPEGIGDDCALISLPAIGRQLATVDPVIFGKHFDNSVSPENAAAKLVKRNASDIAAMGGVPNYALLSLSVPENVRVDWLERFYHGLAQSATSLQIKISGGDLSHNNDSHLSASLSLMGWLDENSRPLLRRTAISGDPVFVSGSLGGSLYGKHYSFNPRLKEGQFLSSQNTRIACLDLSDGLGKDASSLPAPGFAIEIDASALPISDDAEALSQQTGHPPAHHAANDGEDYELLFSIPAENEANIVAEWKNRFQTPLTKIGIVVSKENQLDPDISLINNPMNVKLAGYEHLR
ncbi:thiamine-phosphate kinase [Puniceicoccaceae bacterium K14]|nr:thiamine-phosphate kinase [Puniceicoccaceae bacterium K14]